MHSTFDAARFTLSEEERKSKKENTWIFYLIFLLKINEII